MQSTAENSLVVDFTTAGRELLSRSPQMPPLLEQDGAVLKCSPSVEDPLQRNIVFSNRNSEE
jgi:hypothetical protein